MVSGFAATYAKVTGDLSSLWVLFVAFKWVPIIGDPITLIAGVLKENFYRFLLMVTIAKAGRYLCIYLLYLGVM